MSEPTIDETSQSVGELIDKMQKLGDTTNVAARVSTKAFQEIGGMAESKISGLAAGAFDIYADAMGKAVKAGHVSEKELGAALKGMLANTFKSIGEESAIRGAYMTAKGIQNLADPLTVPLAVGCFISAAEFFAVAALAGVGSGMLGPKGGGGGGATGGASSGGASSDDSGGGDLSILQDVTIIGRLDTRDAENLHGQLQAANKNRDLAS